MREAKTQGKVLQEIINMAIKKEQEAVDFYSDLATKVKSSEVASELHQLSKMEERHRDWLKKVDVSSYVEGPRKLLAELNVENYFSETEVAPGMSLQALFQLALRREREAVRLYSDLAKAFPNPEKRLFENLAAEEAEHHIKLETEWFDR